MKKVAPAFACFCFVLTIFLACQKQDIAKNTPVCITREIADHHTDQQWQFSSVKEYEFQDEVVYVFSPSEMIADAASIVKDANCNVLCTPGGYTVPGPDCKGEFFFPSATYIRTIWKR